MERGKWWAPGGPQRRTGQAVAKRENGEGIRGRISGILAAEPLDFAGGIYGKSRWKKSAARMGELGREDSFLISFAKKENVLLDAITKENPPIAAGLPFRIHV
ncbi:MAG: hypothetical protein C6W57_09170 [Caldibacillus debilis]|uniref:hypothetical protein n=1 Tax=Caldibacillus debilis TaxID=301148 RepID=UPI000E383217|nr:hypothetical protein [Caldibacillus debilis]REJ16269.1 MAG: hypothetical protein C6W57_09170 [Caldibacillus debilis]